MQSRDPKLKRTHKLVITLNDYEADAFDSFCKKYKVKSATKVAREIIINQVLVDMDRNYPTLFDKEELERLVQRM